MRIPLPTRFRARPVVLFATVLFLVQQLEHTDLIFSMLCALYVGLFALAYNAGGGVVFPSGAYIFFNGVLTAILGLVWKAWLGEPADHLLEEPRTTLGVYCLGMAGMGVAAYFSHRLRPRTGLLANMAPGIAMRNAAIGCFIVGLAFRYFAFLLPYGLVTALSQVNRFSQMAVLLATYYEIQASGGRRCSNWIVWLAGLNDFTFGVLTFSKEGTFTPFISWLLPCIILRFRFSKLQIGGILAAAFLSYYFLAPYSQVGRNERVEGAAANSAAVAWNYFSHIENTRKEYIDVSNSVDMDGLPHYYQKPQGLLDRLQMLAFDDALIHYTDQGNVVGVAPTLLTYLNLVPRVFYPNKPTLAYGNLYGREIGVISSADETTGISFSPSGDAYHQARWWGVFLLVPLVTFLLFLVNDSFTGDARVTPWALLPIAVFAHVAPEGLLGGAIYMTVFGAVTLLVIAVLARYVLPILSNVLLGGERVRVRRSLEFRPVASHRVRPPQQAGP